jgi:hypothetical protein
MTTKTLKATKTQARRVKDAARQRRSRATRASGPPPSKQAGLREDEATSRLTTENLAELEARGAGMMEPAGQTMASEASWQRLTALRDRAQAPEGEPKAVSPAEDQDQAQEAAQRREKWVKDSGRARGKVAPRVPLRPQDTPQTEIERYPARRGSWEARPTPEAWKEHQPEYEAHCRACLVVTRVGPVSEGSPVTTCDHAAHLLPRREWRHDPYLDRLDRRHLGTCDAESQADCRDYHHAHRLPPEVLAIEEERCCALGCFLKGDRRALTECVSVPTLVLLRRQAEERAIPGLYGKSLETGGASVITTSYLSESVRWGFNKRIYDPALMPLKDDGWT